MNHVQPNCSSLPPHGRIACRRCFTTEGDTRAIGKWQMVNDPGAWGSATPKVMILGFSKGFTQATAYRAGVFEDIPFKDMRPRLTEALRALGVIGATEFINQKMTVDERDFAFGSLVRCSLSRMNDKGRLECTGQVMPKAFKEEISSQLRQCAETFLSSLPKTLQLVLMLGTTDSYIKGCRAVIRSLYRARFSDINAVSYRTDSVVWTHISHPSGLNGHHPAWMAGNPTSKPGQKRLLAMDAIQLSGLAS